MSGPDVRALLVDGTVVRVRELRAADAPLVARLDGRLPVYERRCHARSSRDLTEGTSAAGATVLAGVDGGLGAAGEGQLVQQ